MLKTDVSKLCKYFSEVVRKKGKSLPTVFDGDRSDEFGWDSESTTYQLKTPDFIAEYTERSRRSWNACNDTYSRSESLSVTYGKNAKFRAYHDLGGRTESFGVGERYQGSQARKPDEWSITGRVPVTLLKNYLKPQTA